MQQIRRARAQLAGRLARQLARPPEDLFSNWPKLKDTVSDVGLEVRPCNLGLRGGNFLAKDSQTECVDQFEFAECRDDALRARAGNALGSGAGVGIRRVKRHQKTSVE